MPNSLYKKVNLINKCPCCNSTQIYKDMVHLEIVCINCGIIFKDSLHTYIDLDTWNNNKKSAKVKEKE